MPPQQERPLPRQDGITSDIQNWFQSLPLVTRWLFALTAAFSVIGSFGLIRPESLVLIYPKITSQFQV